MRTPKPFLEARLNLCQIGEEAIVVLTQMKACQTLKVVLLRT